MDSLLPTNTPHSDPLPAQVAILMGCYNGAAHLAAQLDSFRAQTYPHWTLWASDDGSSDGTPALIEAFLAQPGVAGRCLAGPQRGFCENFMSLISHPDIKAQYYAFADQDDIWLDDKLSRAVAWLEQVDPAVPALYCSRTRLTDEAGNLVGFSPDYRKPPGFGNALLQNIASGNTMVFNHKARTLLQKAHGAPLVVHDWSLYQIVSGCGGVVRFDPTPTVLYRQHGNNQIGNGMSPLRRLRNFMAAHAGRAAGWNDRNYQALMCVADDLTAESASQLAAFRQIRQRGLLARLRLCRKAGVYHQQAIGMLTTLTYVLLNRL
ncbi:glycosyltransferase family 2 protein [Nissabacter sp. SGAir0207]|uniref:glycosyltransferase family 2 protein n=1 Tax=Nissabacter sp. SGAir0207 TaxID=2126321 RepID=UPI0010CCD7FA|nr:glycosyltransferase family 2 protein [Nissabacter sp. SGAir0207]QCR35746.1 glycosyltransferase family 2 protein [Nissabacter sp. SGAir0207]